ncbi:MAG: hypothetical protein IBX40_13255, partial [Methanosarcinales archaeon]|nr:hypothetical protein [Methanosarcinales archaeon]
ASEFETVKKSILVFDDAVRDVAWELGGSRSARFTVNYGQLELMPNDAVKGGLPLIINVTDYPNASYSTYTGYVRYRISTNYVTFGNGYESYILGDDKTIVSAGMESFGRALIKQEPSWVNIILNYRVRAVKTYTVNVTQPDNQTVPVSYVNIWIIKMKITSWSTFIGDFDLTARSFNITTKSYGGSDGNGYPVMNGKCNILAQLGNESDTATIPLDGEKVVFNFIVAEIEVST